MPMSSHKLPNYLRAFRKRTGLSQEDIAFLLGWDCAAHVSRYEHFRRTPNLRTALALHVILQTSMPELFGGQYLKVEKAIRRRAARLVARLSKGSVPVNARKLALLRSMASGTAKRT